MARDTAWTPRGTETDLGMLRDEPQEGQKSGRRRPWARLVVLDRLGDARGNAIDGILRHDGPTAAAGAKIFDDIDYQRA